MLSIITRCCARDTFTDLDSVSSGLYELRALPVIQFTDHSRGVHCWA